MEAVDFRIWKKRKTAGKTAAFDPAFGRNHGGVRLGMSFIDEAEKSSPESRSIEAGG